MTKGRAAFLCPEIFDGFDRFADHALVVEHGRVVGLVPGGQVPVDARQMKLPDGIICPGFVDLQVNGGGGVLFNDDPSADTLRRMARAHISLGATSILPTLITDTPERTQAAIEAVASAVAAGEPGIVGLHLEGPHIAMSRKGAHDARFVRPMTDADLDRLRDAAARLPLLKVTVAPEVVAPSKIAALVDAGVLVSLGHSDADFETCATAVAAGARCATHLFNAMSQFGSREPGLVGAALSLGELSPGLIADGIHVHPESLRLALRAKQGPGRIFLVSDAMAVAGTDLPEFALNGRTVLRAEGRLTLEDGTLAGADLDLLTAVRNLIAWRTTTPETALAMAARIPAELTGLSGGIGTLRPGAPADFLHIDLEGSAPARVWKAGAPV